MATNNEVHPKVAEKLYKTLGERFVAFIIDAFLLSLLSWPIQELILRGEINYLFRGLFDPILFFSYRVLMHSICGQTIGKKIWHIKVVDSQSLEKIGFYQVLLREIIPFLTLLCSNLSRHLGRESFYHNTYSDWLISGLLIIGLLLPLADYIVMITNQRRRALHDYLGKSAVVDLGVLEPVDLTKISFSGKKIKLENEFDETD